MTIQVQVAKVVGGGEITARDSPVPSPPGTKSPVKPCNLNKKYPTCLKEFTSKEDHKTNQHLATWMNALKADSLSDVDDKQADKSITPCIPGRKQGSDLLELEKV